eukprot:SAG22_NODE_1249_length_5012_cov_1.781396_2_plen_195_part_00
MGDEAPPDVAAAPAEGEGGEAPAEGGGGEWDPATAIISKDEFTHPPYGDGDIIGLYLQPDTLTDYGVTKEDDIVSFKQLPKAQIQEECQKKGAMCDWDPVKAFVGDQGDEILLVFDEDEACGESWYLCTAPLAEKVMAAVDEIYAKRTAAHEAANPKKGGGGEGEDDDDEDDEDDEDAEPPAPVIPEIPMPPLM